MIIHSQDHYYMSKKKKKKKNKGRKNLSGTPADNSSQDENYPFISTLFYIKIWKNDNNVNIIMTILDLNQLS